MEMIKKVCKLHKQNALKRVVLNKLSYNRRRKIGRHGGLTFEVIDFPVTQKCTLRCKSCSNLMQYYQDPISFPKEQVFRDMDTMMNLLDYVQFIMLLGGEPFIIDNLSEYVEYLSKYKSKFCTIVIITNGTIVPTKKEMIALSKHTKYLSVQISNYGSLAVNKNKLIQSLTEYKIPFFTNDYCETWKEWGQLKNGEQMSAESHVNKFANCTARCKTVCNGKFYHCAFLANSEALNAIPYSDKNHINLLKENVGIQEFHDYMNKGSTPPGCMYCSGYAHDAPEVPAAEQLKKPREYKCYSDRSGTNV